MTSVLDASAVLAVVFEENGMETVMETIDDSLMSVVNLAEVLTTVARRGIDAGAVRGFLDEFGIVWTSPDEEDAAVAAAFPHDAGLSLGDRFCLALGAVKDMPVLTGDRLWADLDLPIQIELIR